MIARPPATKPITDPTSAQARQPAPTTEITTMLTLPMLPRHATILALTLHTTACAHRQPSPATPPISIAVANIGFGPDNGLTAEEQAECELGPELFEELHDEVDDSFALHSVGGYRDVPGLVLVMRFARIEGQEFASGIKSIVLEGKLLQDGQVTADFVAMRYTSNGAFGTYNRGFKSSCGILEDVVEELAEDVGEWLREPTMHAQLGDL